MPSTPLAPNVATVFSAGPDTQSGGAEPAAASPIRFSGSDVSFRLPICTSAVTTEPQV